MGLRYYMRILIKNAVILTCESEDYFRGCIEMTDDRITGVYIGAASDTKLFDRVIDADKMIAMPGLVNAHTHAAMTLMRNYGGGLGLEDWLTEKIFPVEEKLSGTDIYFGTLLAGIEMIRSGTTAFADMYYSPDYICKAADELGIRANVCAQPIDPVNKSSEYLKVFLEKWDGGADSRIKPYVMVHSAYLYGEKELMISARMASEMNTGIHTHLLETKKEYFEGIKKYGMDNAEEMYKCGIFDVPVIAAHCVHVTDKDIGILAAKNVNVVHNPTSNLKLGSGIAPLQKMIDAGINVCLGTDGAASNNTLDMFEEIKLAALLQKGANQDPEQLRSTDVLKMASVNGAKALGFGYGFGSIKAGAKADIILIDTDKPHFTPLNDPYEAVVYTCHGSDVDTVIIDGKILMEKRKLLCTDEEKIMYEVNRIAQRVIT
jgi:5-methylthioadenosine/S-adenosylhomocysteine deaminase